MTQGDMILQVFERLREVVDTERLNDGTVRQVLNAAYQDIYAEAVAVNPEWYTTSHTFGSTALLALPSVTDAKGTVMGCYNILAYTGTNGAFGGARVLDHRTPERVNLNYRQKGVTGDPVAVWTGANIEHTPAFGGTLWYLWNFGEVTDDTAEITNPGASRLAYIPSVFEEAIIMSAMTQLRMRFANAQGDTTVAEENLKNLTTALNMIEMQSSPDAIYAADVQRPSILPNQDQQQQ